MVTTRFPNSGCAIRMDGALTLCCNPDNRDCPYGSLLAPVSCFFPRPELIDPAFEDFQVYFPTK